MPSARILLLDDDEDILALVSHTLNRDGFTVSSAGVPSAALQLAKRFEFDLVVADVNLPEMNGFAFRDAFRAGALSQKAPFVFMSAADQAIELEIASELRGDPLLLKPFSRADLRKAVHTALQFWRVVVGPIPGQLDAVMREAEETSGTGILTAVRPEISKKVVFLDGKVVFAFSSDPRDLIGQAFIRAGLISEHDLLAAFVKSAEMPPPPGTPALGAALTALRKVTPEQSRAVFERKVRESVLELYLWKSGEVEFAETELREADRPFSIVIDPAVLRAEGLQHRANWAKVEALLPDRNVAFAPTGKDLPAGFPATAGERQLMKYLQEGRSFAEILLETRGQDYAVGMRLASLVRTGVLVTEPSKGFRGAVDRDVAGADLHADRAFETSFEALFEELAPPTRSPSPFEPAVKETAPPWAKAFASALLLLRKGAADEARRELLRVLQLDPRNALARASLEKAQRMICDQARASGLADDRIVALGVPLATLVGRKMGPNDAFVLSRLAAGKMSVAQLLQVCPLPEFEVFATLQRAITDGLVR